MTLRHRGFPIRRSTGQSLFPAHRGLSQVVASFIGSWCQGIHLMLFFAWTALLAFVLFKICFFCLSFANNCLGCGLLKRPCFLKVPLFSTRAFQLKWQNCFLPLIIRKDLLISQLKNLLNTTICSFLSFLYSVFNERLLCAKRTSRIRLRVSHSHRLSHPTKKA